LRVIGLGSALSLNAKERAPTRKSCARARPDDWRWSSAPKAPEKVLRLALESISLRGAFEVGL